jgi:hypothetical protein
MKRLLCLLLGHRWAPAPFWPATWIITLDACRGTGNVRVEVCRRCGRCTAYVEVTGTPAG